MNDLIRAVSTTLLYREEENTLKRMKIPRKKCTDITIIITHNNYSVHDPEIEYP